MDGKVAFTKFLLTLILLTRGFLPQASAKKHPVILVPGLFGSQLFCKLDNNTEAFHIWLDEMDLLFGDNFSNYLPTVDNKTTHKQHDLPGVHIFAPGWGDTWSTEYLNNATKLLSGYLRPIVEALKSDDFYVSGSTLRSAPYDFRKAAWEADDFMQMMRLLVEETYNISGDREVVLVCHSLGCIYSLRFLSLQSDAWKQAYIKSLVTIAGPFGGSTKTLKTEAYGDNFNIFIRSPLLFRPLGWTFSSMASMMPDKRFLDPTKPLVVTPQFNYTADDYERFFRDIGFPQGYEKMAYAQASFDASVGSTGIDQVYCIYGRDVPTEKQLIYYKPTFWRKAFPDQNPTIVYDNGDGTVHEESLSLCGSWKNTTQVSLSGIGHSKLLKDMRVLGLIMEVAGANHTNLSSVENKIAKMRFPGM